jgi:transposase
LAAVPVAAARPISPTATERHLLKKAAWGHKTEHRLRVRAQIVLHAARGLPNARIAERVGVHVDTVRTWRKRFAELGMPGLVDRKRTGRPPSFTPLQAAQVKALARDALKPWQYRSWIFITDPDFRPKAERVLDLYARTCNGESLGADEYIISADERRPPSRPAAAATPPSPPVRPARCA